MAKFGSETEIRYVVPNVGTMVDLRLLTGLYGYHIEERGSW